MLSWGKEARLAGKCKKSSLLDVPNIFMLVWMNELEEFKTFLGPSAKRYNNAQLQQLRREMNGIAELLLDIYLSKIGKKAKEQRFDRDEAND